MPDSPDLLNAWLAAKRKREPFPVPEHATPAYVTLQSSDIKFEPEFLKRLYVLEQAMADKGLDPAAFSISKNRMPSSGYTPYNGMMDYIFYDYTISFHEHSFNVREEGDMAFLSYFSNLCLSDEHEDFDEPHARHKSFFTKLIGWLEGDAFSPLPKAD